MGLRFSNLELTLLSALANVLSAEARRVLQEQVDRVKRIQRLQQCREINLYTKRGKSGYWESVALFTRKDSELKVAHAKFGFPDRTESWLADFWLVQGHIFSICIQPSPKQFLHRADGIVEKLTLLIDPMLEVRPRTESIDRLQLHSVSLGAWLSNLKHQIACREASDPCTRSRLQAALGAFNTSFPADYIDLLILNDEISIDGIDILGLHEIYSVYIGNSEYYVVAVTNTAGFFLVRSGDSDGLVYYQGFNEVQPSTTCPDFRSAIEWYLARERNVRGHSSGVKVEDRD